MPCDHRCLVGTPGCVGIQACPAAADQSAFAPEIFHDLRPFIGFFADELGELGGRSCVCLQMNPCGGGPFGGWRNSVRPTRAISRGACGLQPGRWEALEADSSAEEAAIRSHGEEL